MKLDYSLMTSEERLECVNQLIAETPREELTPQYLNYITNYILFTNDKGQTTKERKENDGGILTKNREITINKREISYEGLVSSLENGEDGIYNIAINDKNQLLDRRSPITESDIAEIPHLQEYMDTIQKCQKRLETAEGKTKYLLKKQIIETWQQMYIVKAGHLGIPCKGSPPTQIKTMVHLPLSDNVTFDQDGMPHSDAILTLFNPLHVSFLLCYYAQLKEETIDNFEADMRFMIMDLENLVNAVIRPNEVLFDLLIWKIDGMSNEDIVREMESKHGIRHTEQYYSTLWRKRIPKLISQKAIEDYTIWYYSNVEYGNWKKCNKCGKTKLAHPLFFARNSSKDGFYSICKSCKSGK